MNTNLSDFNANIRRKGIGGSEVAAILGMDEFSSPYKVWLDKTGRESSTAHNKYTKAGLILESAVVNYFEMETKYRIIKSSAHQQTFTHPDYEFAIGTPDRIYVARNKIGKGILECKTTQHSFEDVPGKWFMQLQWYLGILGLNYGGVAWLERGLDFKYKEYEFDKEFFDYLIRHVAEFWTENVQKNIPPEPINSADIERMFKKHREGAVIQATPELIEAHKELLSTRLVISELEAKEVELTNSFKMAMGDAEAVMSGLKPIITWKSSKPYKTFDKDKFKIDNPDLYEQYQKDVEGSRRFLVKPTNQGA